MADWQAFATAFMRDTAGYINERKDKAEDYKDKLMETADRNKAKLGQLRQAAKAQQGYIAQAKQLYATPEQIEAALDAGPTGVRDLATKLQTWKATYGASYTEDLVKTKISLPEGFEATGNLDPMSRYGLKNYVVGDVEKPKSGWFSRAMGTDAKARARAELDAETFGDTGMSVYDLAQLSEVSGYESQNPSSFVSYIEPSFVTAAKKPEEIEALTKAQRNAVSQADDLYNFRIEQINSKTYSSDDNENFNLKQKEIAKANSDRVASVQRIMNTYVDAKRGMYDNYDSMMADVLPNYGISPTSATSKATESYEPEVQSAIDSAVSGLAPYLSGEVEIDGVTYGLATTPQGQRIRDENGDMLSVEETKQLLSSTGAEVTTTGKAPDVVSQEKAETAESPTAIVEARFDKDGNVADYADLYKSLMDLPEDQRSKYAQVYNELEGSSTAPELFLMAKDALSEVVDDAPAAVDYLAGKGFGGAKWGMGAFSEGLARSYQFITGDKTKTAEQVLRSRENREVAKDIMKDGMMQYIKELYDGEMDLSKLGATELNTPKVRQALSSDTVDIKDVYSELLSSDTEAKEPSPDLTEAAERAPEHIEKLGDQASKLWSDLTAVAKGYQQVAQDARKQLNVDKIVEDAANGEKAAIEVTRQLGRIMSVPDDSMDAKARRGTGRTAMSESTLSRGSARKMEVDAFFKELRRTNPEYFIDTPLDVVDGDTASQVAAQARTGSDRAPNNTGMMSRPAQPAKAGEEVAATTRDDVDVIRSLISRVHGAKSAEAKKFNRSKSMTTADIAKLVRKTKNLPKTDTRDRLLESLYALRDSMTNR